MSGDELKAAIRGHAGAERYWEGRWRDEKAENERLRVVLHRVLATERRKVRENRAEWFDDVCHALAHSSEGDR
jgi:hypothetical protein